MGKPVSLDSVYNKVNFQADTIHSYQPLEDLEKVFRKREKRDKDANLLMLECQKAAVRRSPKTCQGLNLECYYLLIDKIIIKNNYASRNRKAIISSDCSRKS